MNAQTAELVACLRIMLSMFPMQDCPTIRERCRLAIEAVEYDPAACCGSVQDDCFTAEEEAWLRQEEWPKQKEGDSA